MRQFGILIAIALAAGQPGTCAEILHIDPEAQTALSQPARAELGLIGVNVHRFRGNAALDLARDAGFRFARADLLWERVERGGAYRFQAYDALMNALEARGMGALLILDYGHPDHGGKVPRNAEDIAAFGRFAEAAASHFKGRDVRYEIWNEPDIVQFWPPKPNAQEYAALLREAVSAIHRADPAAKVVSGGVSRLDLKFLRKAIDPGRGCGVDRDRGASLSKGETRKRWGRSSRSCANGLVSPLENVSKSGTRNGDIRRRILPGGLWETVIAAKRRLRQARLAVREMLTVWSVGFPLAVWYDLQDDGADAGNPEQNYGLLDANGAEKPAMQAVRTVMTAVKGRQYAGMIQRAPSGMHAMRFDGPADVLFIVWNDRAGKRQTIRYTKDNLLSVTGLMGNTVEQNADSSREAQMEIDEASGPIYLRLETPASPATRRDCRIAAHGAAGGSVISA